MKMMKKKKSSFVADKAWDLLRLALFWARKVAALKKKKGLKVKYWLGDKAPPCDHHHRIYYFERQLSFDKTPDFRYNNEDRGSVSLGFLFPCVGSKTVEFDYAIGDDDDDEDGGRRGSYSTAAAAAEEEEEEKEEYEYEGSEKKSGLEDDEGIDSRAEKFIAEFYHQIRFRN